MTFGDRISFRVDPNAAALDAYDRAFMKMRRVER